MSDTIDITDTDLTEQSISYLVRKAHRSFVSVLAERLTPYGIAVSEWTVLRMLWLADDITQVELAARMHLQKSSLTSTLKNLETKQLITRKQRPEDRRKSYLHLTSAGKILKVTLMPYGLANNQRALAGFTPAETDQFRDFLERVITNLERN